MTTMMLRRQRQTRQDAEDDGAQEEEEEEEEEEDHGEALLRQDAPLRLSGAGRPHCAWEEGMWEEWDAIYQEAS